MTDANQLVDLLQGLDSTTARHSQLEAYYEGRPALSYLSAEAKTALARFDRMSSNVCRTAVLAVQERLRVSGFTGADAWSLWTANNLDQTSAKAHRDALLYGQGFVIVWAGADGRPVASIESPKAVAVQRDPATREITAAVKRWRSKTQTFATVFLPDRVLKWGADSPSAAMEGFKLVETLGNPLDVVPVVALGLEDEASAIADLMPLQDALNKLLLDAMVSSEYSGRPRRWATGIELVEKPVTDADGNAVIDGEGHPVKEAVNPIPEGNRAMMSEKEGAKFGQLPAADLAGFEAGVRVILAQAMMVSGLPAHYLGQLTAAAQPTSADALRASEAALVARAEARQLAYGTGWETVAKLLVAIRDGSDPNTVAVQVKWSPADTRSQAQEADAVVKLVQANILPITYALAKLGYSDDEIVAIRAAKRAEALDSQAVDINALTTPPAA